MVEENKPSLDKQTVKALIEECGYMVCHTETERGREEEKQSYSDLNLSVVSTNYLEGREIIQLWKHQYLAVKAAKEGKNVCVTTSTSSGKSEIFILSALELLAKDPNAKVLAVYPMKALNRQQVRRWQKAYGEDKIGKIDGDTKMDDRLHILQTKRVVIMTPDVIHAWLLDNLNETIFGNGDIIKDFIRSISLVVIDELHLYKGMFGTNSAYLFRRLNNVRCLLRGTHDIAQYITASATLPNACEHSFNITGAKNFVEIGMDLDGSPMYEKTFFFVEVADTKQNPSVSRLVEAFAEKENTRSITFVESRQKTGSMANNILGVRGKDGKDDKSEIYGYRSGYEVASADIIDNALENGKFKGVISTSALEIGIDIEGLNVCIIADMPHDKNSYQQRIGRVGRYNCGKSYVIIVKDNNSLPSKLLFEEFGCDIDKVLPNYEPALYLEDPTIQNVQALTHVGDHDYCEYKQWKDCIKRHQTFAGKELFPQSFGELCEKVLNGQTPREYDEIAVCVDNPQRAYTLRHFGKQFTIEAVKGEEEFIPKGEHISREQIVTEGYPQAIRFTYKNGEQIREEIHRVLNAEYKIIAKKNKERYTTSSLHRGYVIPNFDESQRFGSMEFGDCVAFNLKLQEHQTVYGYNKKVFDKSEYNQYDDPYFLPTLKTTGTVIIHPAFNEKSVNVSNIADIMFETFLRLRAFDRSDISHKGGRLYSDYEHENLHVGDRFVVLYDTNELNITKKLLDEQLLKELMGYIKKYLDIIVATVCPNMNDATRQALISLCDSVLNHDAKTDFVSVGSKKTIKAGSVVLYRQPNGEEGEDNGVECIYFGEGNIEGTCNLCILKDGVMKSLLNISLECIEATSETIFE